MSSELSSRPALQRVSRLGISTPAMATRKVYEADAAVGQVMGKLYQLGERAAEAVEFPHSEHVARLQGGERFLELGAIGGCAAGLVIARLVFWDTFQPA